MHQWKKILAEGKLIKEVIIQGDRISITLHDQYNHKENYYSINTMFANLWYLTTEFRAIFEKSLAHNQTPFLKLKNINTYQTAHAALNALIALATKKQKINEKLSLANDEEIEEVEPVEEKEVNTKKKRGVVHAWKKLLSNGELIESLEIKESLVYIKLFEEYNKKPFFKGVNIMLKKMYHSSAECQMYYRQPTAHTSSPYLILLKQNTYPDPIAALHDLVNMANAQASKPLAKKQTNDIERVEITLPNKTNHIEEPANILQEKPKIEDVYDIFNDLLAEPIYDSEEREFALADIESDRPFLGFNFTLPTQLPQQAEPPVLSPKVPILHLKIRRH